MKKSNIILAILSFVLLWILLAGFILAEGIPPSPNDNPPIIPQEKPIEESPMPEENLSAFPKATVVKIDYFVMSFCPYCNMIETQAMIPFYEEMKGHVKLQPHYVIYSYNDFSGAYCLFYKNKSYCAMHGINELNEDVREVCVRNKYNTQKYLQFVAEIDNRCNITNIDLCWKDVADSLRINTKVIETCVKKESKNILAKELRITNKFGVDASPTVFINGEKFEWPWPRTAESLKQAVCTAFRENHIPKVCLN